MTRFLAISVLAGILALGGLAAISSPAFGQAPDPSTAQRLNQLEAETQTLRAEIERLRAQPPQRPPVADAIALPTLPADPTLQFPTTPAPPAAQLPTAIPNPAAILTQPAPAIPAAPPAIPTPPAPLVPTDSLLSQPQADYYTLDQVQAEMKKLTWKKGDFSVTPYGFLWANMVYETERSNIGDYTLWVFSAQEQGEPTFHVDARNTRLGMDILGPKLPYFYDAQTGGKVEIDFQGSFVTENKGSVLLRHAYAEIYNEQFRLLAGETWDVISPVIPDSIMYSVYWDAGNIGYRRAQFRGESFTAFSDTLLLTLQASLNGNIAPDTSSVASADQSGWPVLEGRAALTFGPRGKEDHPIVCGVSSHIGEQRFTFANAKDLTANTWSLNGDLRLPVNQYWGFLAECYIGENLSAFLGGIGQGYDFTLRKGIYDQGGWMEVYCDASPQWHYHAGYTLDDPDNNDIASAAGRTYNQAIFGNVMYNVTKQFVIGLEVASWKTLYKAETPGESIRTEFMARYGF